MLRNRGIKVGKKRNLKICSMMKENLCISANGKSNSFQLLSSEKTEFVE